MIIKMNKNQIIKDLIATTIAGQGNQVDSGGKLAEILDATVDAVASAQDAAASAALNVLECRLQELAYPDETLLAPKTSGEQDAIIKAACQDGTVSKIAFKAVVTQADHDANRLTDYPVGYGVIFPIVSGIYDTQYSVFRYTVNCPIKALNGSGGANRATVRSFTFVESL